MKNLFSKKPKSNPFEKFDASLSDDSCKRIADAFGEIAFKLTQVWNSLSAEERNSVLASAQEIGMRLVSQGVKGTMMGETPTETMGSLMIELAKSQKLAKIFQAVMGNG